MRYRIFDKDILVGSYRDSDQFHHSFMGEDENNPVGGVVKYDHSIYYILNFKKCDENFSDLYAKCLTLADCSENSRDYRIRKYFVPIH